MLLSRRALPDLDNELVPKPLVVACASRHVAIARLLLQHHAQVELVNSTECLPECMLIASLIRWSSSIRLSASLSASLMTSLITSPCPPMNTPLIPYSSPSMTSPIRYALVPPPRES
jgi:hypothetical protein